MPLLAEVPIPYDRSSITPGIVHFGVGQFCRGFLFFYTHRMFALNAKTGAGGEHAKEWGIVGVNVMEGEREIAMQRCFRKQNCLYSLTRFPHKDRSDKSAAVPAPLTTVIGSMLDYLYAPSEGAKVIEYLASPKIKIVSMTVTEGGYNINEKTNEFDLTNAAVLEDLKHPETPRTSFGFIVEGLRRRRELLEKSGGKELPFTVMSCDNLRNNGDVAKRAILGYAKARDADLAAWIEANVKFPNSMVDRITPATTPEVKKRLQAMPNGIKDDEQPVIGEAFNQWVLEDKFVGGRRPEWEKVGLELTTNVAGYEHTKIRILNSSHLFCTFCGLLLGHRFVHTALADPDIFKLVERSLDCDVLPTLTSPMDKFKYKETILSRFSNAAIADQLLRIALDGTSKVQVFWANNIIAVLKRAQALKKQRGGKAPRDLGLHHFAFGLASFLVYLDGVDANGKKYPVIEPKLAPESWKATIDAGGEDPAVLNFNAFDPWRNEPGHEEMDKWVKYFRADIHKKGARKAMRDIARWDRTLEKAKL